MTANLYVVIEKPNEEEERRIKDAIDILEKIDSTIGKCSTNAWEDYPEFRKAATQLRRVLAGEWSY